jgi:PKD repeat protein
LKNTLVYWLTCIFLTVAVAAEATTIVLPTDEQLISKSPFIVEGTVASSQSIERSGAIHTETALDVDQVLKGSGLPARLTIDELGGRSGDRITVIYGSPVYTSGERVLVFLFPTRDGRYRTADLFIGKFTETRSRSGQRLFARNDEAADVTLLDHDFQPLQARNIKRDAAGFEAYVTERAAGRDGKANYGIPDTPSKLITGSDSLKTSANFTLLDEGTVYRWSSFDSGQQARWYSVGTQPGYSGGGATEAGSGIAAWTSYSSAKILYSYAGASSAAAGGNDRSNGINEIDFNDPTAEIPGTFNRTTGGVVGQGGFSGARAGGSWTAPFTYDAGHAQTSYASWTITEGNMVIQDGVSPTNGIPAVTLAEIIAHEFGHTLGFGHSTDKLALMYPSVTGRGPNLGTDDQTAARWLYPTSSVVIPPGPTVTVPAAPSNLSASAGASSLFLQWTDNAPNETVEYVYLAAGNGGFSRAQTLAAGSNNSTISGLTPGNYRIYVTAANSAGESIASNTALSTIAMPITLTASFTVTPASGNAGQTISFVDQSSGGVTSRAWTFGDGNASSAVNPQHVYAVSGNFNVTLTVYGSGGAQAFTSSYVYIAPAVPVTPQVTAAFALPTASAKAGQTVQFTDQSSGSPASWLWTFGDGGSSNQKNPSHTYAAAGQYTVSLTTSNSGSSSTVSHVLQVASNAVPYRSLVSVSAQTNGLGGSYWRTELSVYNAGHDSATLRFTFVPGAGGAILTADRFLNAHQSLTVDNALLDLFGMQSGAGAISVDATNPVTSPDLRISSRTFTGGSDGTYGQSVPDIRPTMAATTFVTGISANADFRTNLGIVNSAAYPVGATLTLSGSDGATISQKRVTLPASNFQQSPLGTWFPELGGTARSGMRVRVDADVADAVSAYASVVDNRSQDPIYIQGAPLTGGNVQFVAGSGRTPGANNTYWRTDLAIFNPNSGSSTFALRFLPAGQDNRGAQYRTATIAGGRLLELNDVAAWFGLTNATGAVEITSTSSTYAPIVTARTYTNGANGGTYGQSVDPVTSFGQDSIVTGMRSSRSYRSNIGLLNAGDITLGVNLSILGQYGETLASGFVTLPPRSQSQASLAALFPGVDLSNAGSFTLQAHTDNASALFAYGSVIDNGTGDPVFFAGK